MPNALLTGVSGLVAHQRMLEVVGNNLANINTTAYKTRRTLFSDLLYTTIRPAANANSADVGGTNPNQVGSGVKVALIDRMDSQGNLEPTGGLLDFALQGEGYFMVHTGNQNLYSRAGAFSLDEQGFLVDPSTGYRVQRFGAVGEDNGTSPGFQTPGDSAIRIPFGAVIAGEATTAATLSGNFSADSVGPLAEVLTTANPYTEGGSAITTATLLNNLDSNAAPYGAGDTIQIGGTDVDGTPVSATLAVDGTTTVGDLAGAITGTFPGATASVDASGNLVLTADAIGEAFLTLTLSDSVGNAGGTNFGNHLPVVSVEGNDGDIFQNSMEIFDVQGRGHTVNLTFQKVGDSVWDMTADIDPSEGTVLDGLVQQIQFSDDGSLQQVLGTGLGDRNISFQFAGISAAQSIELTFGGSNLSDGLTHLALDSSLSADQDGFPPGELVSINVSADGVIAGVSTNGRILPIAQLALVSFSNSKGLTALGDNYFEESLNSGEAQVGSALTGKRGSVTGGQLESSNVDIAFEFTRLIVAQRGFSANARTITVADEVLEELTNLIR